MREIIAGILSMLLALGLWRLYQSVQNSYQEGIYRGVILSTATLVAILATLFLGRRSP